ncbi:unnamed protein product [Cochlearia groenlandica]
MDVGSSRSESLVLDWKHHPREISGICGSNCVDLCSSDFPWLRKEETDSLSRKNNRTTIWVGFSPKETPYAWRLSVLSSSMGTQGSTTTAIQIGKRSAFRTFTFLGLTIHPLT